MASPYLTTTQAKSNGLLEVTVLISGEYRKRNIPGAAFRKGAGKLLANARGLVSPAGSVHSTTVTGRWVGGLMLELLWPCAAVFAWRGGSFVSSSGVV